MAGTFHVYHFAPALFRMQARIPRPLNGLPEMPEPLTVSGFVF